MKRTIFFALILGLLPLFSLNAQTEVDAPGDEITQVIDQDPAINENGDAINTTDPVGPDPVDEVPEPTAWENVWAFFKAHWGALILGLFAFIEVVVRLTPTEKDDAWFNWIKSLIDAIIPNRSKFGGTHPTRR